jgi:hypothetical protein
MASSLAWPPGPRPLGMCWRWWYHFCMSGLGEMHLHISACGSPADWPGPRQFSSLNEFVSTYDRIWTAGKDRPSQLRKLVDNVSQLRQRMDADGCDIALVSVTVTASSDLDELQGLAQQLCADNTPDSTIVLLAGWLRGCPEPDCELALNWAQECPYVVAVGIAGNERIPLREIDVRGLQWARDAHLLTQVHAGEISDARDVWAAIDAGACRIAHGIRAVGDRRLLAYMADNQIACDLSIYSNRAIADAVGTGHHPLGELLDAGVVCTLNTDDPAIFGQTLDDEFAAATTLVGSTQALRDYNRQAGELLRELANLRAPFTFYAVTDLNYPPTISGKHVGSIKERIDVIDRKPSGVLQTNHSQTKPPRQIGPTPTCYLDHVQIVT